MANRNGSTRIIKYPNRRLYCQKESRYITRKDITERVRKRIPVEVVLKESEQVITRSTLLSVLSEMEDEGAGRISETELLEFIRREPLRA